MNVEMFLGIFVLAVLCLFAVGAILLTVVCFYEMVACFQCRAFLLGLAGLALALIFIVLTVALIGIGIQAGLYFFLP